MAETPPFTIKESLSKEEGEKMVEQFKALGCEVELK